MKTNLTFRSLSLVLFMVVLIFFTPFTTFAQQDSVEVQTERDAKADVSVIKWFIVGAGASCGGIICLGVTTGAFEFDLLSPPPPNTPASVCGMEWCRGWLFIPTHSEFCQSIRTTP